jgi:hypothetical protein
MPAPSPDKLVVFWSKRERDFMFRYPRSWDGGYAHTVFCSERPRVVWGDELKANGGFPIAWDPSFVKELEARGYDTTTLRFEVQRRKDV